MPCKTELPVAGDRGVRIRLPPPAGLSWCGALLSAVVRGSTAPFLGSSSRGTEGSNPSPSSGESCANLTFADESAHVASSSRRRDLLTFARRQSLHPRA